MNLTTEQPIWFILFCLLLGFAYAWILYRKNEFRTEDGITPKWVYGLMFLRAFVVSFIAFLLLGPLVKTFSRKVEKPIIILASDNSASVLANKDSSKYRTTFPEQIEKLVEELQEDFNVKTYTFSHQPEENGKLDFTGKQSNLSAVFKELGNQYENQNIGAVILSSDGIFNEGTNPLYQLKEIKAPVFTVALGDTNQQKDLIISNVKHNELAYLGNTFPLQIEIEATYCNGNNVKLEVLHDGKVIHTQGININSSEFRLNIPLQIKADKKGIQHYHIRVSGVNGEISKVNNFKDVFIEVIDGRQKILILAAAPHPDLGAIRLALESNENYELNVIYSTEISQNPPQYKNYNLVIFHQIPTTNGHIAEWNKIKELKIPLLLIIGSQTALNQLNAWNTGINITGGRGATNDVLPLQEMDFSMFTISNELSEFLKKAPPFQAPFGNYKTSGDADIFLRQQIGYVKTDLPLIFFSKSNSSKIGVICGEGYWRWRLYDYSINNNHLSSSELISKIIQYLAATEDKRYFRIVSQKRKFLENESVAFDAEVYNQSYELVNTADVEMEIKNREGKKFNFVFSKTSNAYTLDAGLFPAGSYTYTARVKSGNIKEVLNGNFTVSPLQVEYLETVADHSLLAAISQRSNGEMVSFDNILSLAEKIKKKEQIRPIIYNDEKIKDLLELKWLFFLILTLVSLEWFLRKRNGSY